MINPISVAIFGLGLACSAASAGVWEEFEARCLKTMEEVAPADVTGLTRVGAFEGFDVWTERGNWELRLLFSNEDGDLCLLSGFDWSEEIAKGARSWVESALVEERYEQLPQLRLQSSPIFRSTVWREPRIEVSFQSFDAEWGPYLIVRETDLES